MDVFEIEIDSSEKLVDITPIVRDYIHQARLKKGIVQLHVPEKTAALAVLINDDHRLEWEFFRKINHLLPKYEGMMFTGWTTANVKAALFGASETLMVEEGTLILDLNQSLYFIEFNGPGKRSFFITTMGSELLADEVAQVPEKLSRLHQKRQKIKEEEAQAIAEMRAEWRLEDEKNKKDQ